MTARPTPVTTAAPRLAVILRLVAGRGVFRLGVQFSSVALVTVWDGATFGHFASAIGLFGWLPVAAAAPEKAALKVLPRTRLLAPALARMTIALSAAPAVALLGALVPVALTAPDSLATTYLAAATLAAWTGLLMTVSGLHRLSGRPVLDTVAFGASAGVVLAVTAVTWFTGWAPRFHLMSLVAGIVVVTGCAIAALPREWLRARPGRRLLPRLVRTTVLLGVSDLADSAGSALIFAVLAASGQVTDSGPFYLLILGSTMVCNLVFYLLRVTQPATSARLRGTGGDAGRVRALGLLRRAERCGVAFAVVFAVVAAVPGARVWFAGDGAVVVVLLAVLVLVEVGMFVTVMYAGYLLENTDNRVLTVTSSSALIGLLAMGVLAVALVPVLGVAGGVAVLVLAPAAKAYPMRRMLLRARPELAGP